MGITTKIQVGDETREIGSLLLTDGTTITAGSDLNDFKTLGTFLCNSDATAQSLLHSPFNGKFTMDVSRPAGSPTWFLQELITIDGKRYTRNYNPNISVWSEWLHDLVSNGDTITGDVTTIESGNTLTIPLTFISKNIDELNPPSSTSNRCDILVKDKNNYRKSQIRVLQKEGGNIETIISSMKLGSAQEITESNSNKFVIGITPDLTRYYSVSDPEAFRKAIGITKNIKTSVVSATGSNFTKTYEEATYYTIGDKKLVRITLKFDVKTAKSSGSIVNMFLLGSETSPVNPIWIPTDCGVVQLMDKASGYSQIHFNKAVVAGEEIIVDATYITL